MEAQGDNTAANPQLAPVPTTAHPVSPAKVQSDQEEAEGQATTTVPLFVAVAAVEKAPSNYSHKQTQMAPYPHVADSPLPTQTVATAKCACVHEHTMKVGVLVHARAKGVHQHSVLHTHPQVVSTPAQATQVQNPMTVQPPPLRRQATQQQQQTATTQHSVANQVQSYEKTYTADVDHYPSSSSQSSHS